MEERCRCCQGFLHRIEKGDTLYKLGQKYGVSVSALLFANPYIDLYNLQIGDELCIPKLRPVVIPSNSSDTLNCYDTDSLGRRMNDFSIEQESMRML